MRTKRFTPLVIALAAVTAVAAPMVVGAQFVPGGQRPESSLESEGLGPLGITAGYSKTLTYDPTPGKPGDECTITFASNGNSAQAQADVNAAHASTQNALNNSDDMRTKVGDACSKHGNQLTVNVNRDDQGNTIGNTNGAGTVNIDPGDIDALSAHLSGKPQDKAKLVAAFLGTVIAHEIDHNRETATDSHADPATDSGTTGKPVDDENAVNQDLGNGVHRNNYGYRGADGNWKIDWTVDTQKVTLCVSSLIVSRTAAHGFAPGTEHAVPPPEVLDLPDEPCSELGTPDCYFPPSLRGDADHDGVPDFTPAGEPLDNCLGLANPQQTDSDHDGVGHGCDPDDDGDGRDGWSELGLGSSDLDQARVPEHWALNHTCINGIDDDRDGFADVDDQSCIARLPRTVSLPGSVPVRDVFPPDLRRDLGGVPERLGTIDSFFDITFDVDLDGLPDAKWTGHGPQVVRWSEPHELGGPGIAGIDTEIVALELGGAPPVPMARLRSDRPSLGQAIDLDPDPGYDFPAESFFDVFLELEVPPTPGGYVNHEPLRVVAEVLRWPAHGEIYRKPPFAPPVWFEAREPGFHPIVALDWAMGGYGQGDCNADRIVDAGDISMEILEIFDGDGDAQPFVTLGTSPGRPIGCDANGDARLDAGDVSCTILMIFGGPGACGGEPM